MGRKKLSSRNSVRDMVERRSPNMKRKLAPLAKRLPG